MVLAGLRNMNGVLEFIDTADFTSMNSGEHFMATDIEWDPTGRYVLPIFKSLNISWPRALNLASKNVKVEEF